MSDSNREESFETYFCLSFLFTSVTLCRLSFKSFFWQFHQRRKNNAINYEKSIQQTVPLEIQTINYEKSIQHTIPLEIQTRTLKH